MVIFLGILLGLSPFLMGISNLNAQDTAKILEMYITLLRHSHCQFPVIRYFFGIYIEILFLGAFGIFFMDCITIWTSVT